MVVAGTAIGLYPDIPSAVRRVIAFDGRNRWTPNPENQKIYREISVLAADIYRVLRDGGIYADASKLDRLLRERKMTDRSG
jgi:hypothetical protein